MRIAACVKVIPEEPIWLKGNHRLDPGTFRLARDGRPLLSPLDRHAVEEALRLREAAGEGEVVVVSMAPAAAVDALRSALAMGADRALLLADEALAGSDLLVTSRVLARALEQESPELVLFGPQGEDSNGAVLWAAVAERLRLPVVSKAARVEVAGALVRVERQTEHGFDAIEAPLPCVVGVAASINQPRYAAPRGVLAAKTKPVRVLALADLGLAPGDAGEAGSATEVRALGDPPRRPEAHLIRADGAGAAEQLLAYLTERAVL